MNQIGQKLHDEKLEQFSKQNIYLAGGFTIIYLLWTFFFVGLRTDHFYFLSFCLIAFFSTRISRQFILGFIFFLLYWIIYDSMRVYPNYMVNPVHIEDLYNIEKSLFGISTINGVITPNEYFENQTNTTFDILSGLFYLTWVPVPIMLAIYFFLKTVKCCCIFH